MNSNLHKLLFSLFIFSLALNARINDLRPIKNSLNLEQKNVIESIQEIRSDLLTESLIKLLIDIPKEPNRPRKDDYVKTKMSSRLKTAEVITGYGAGGASKDSLLTKEGTISKEFDEPAYKKDLAIFEEKYSTWHRQYQLANTVLHQITNGDIETLKKINKLRPELNLAQKFGDLIHFLKEAEYSAQLRETEAVAEEKFETHSPRLEAWYWFYTKCALASAVLLGASLYGAFKGPQEAMSFAVMGGTVGALGIGASHYASSNHIKYYENKTATAKSNVELIKKFENLKFD